MKCPSAGVEQWFLCDKWLATDEGDGVIERTLYEAKDMRRDRKKSKGMEMLFVWILVPFLFYVSQSFILW